MVRAARLRVILLAEVAVATATVAAPEAIR